MSSGSSRKQPVLLGFLTLVFAFVLYSKATAEEADGTESGFSGASFAEEVVATPTPSLVQSWRPPAVKRNPFEGLYTAGVGVAGPERGGGNLDDETGLNDGSDEVIVGDEDFADEPPALGFDPEEESQSAEFGSG